MKIIIVDEPLNVIESHFIKSLIKNSSFSSPYFDLSCFSNESIKKWTRVIKPSTKQKL